MRLVIQRVKEAVVGSVKTGKEYGKIGPGLFVLFGTTEGDTPDKALRAAEKIVRMRLMEDSVGKINNSVADSGGAILVVPQFTLYGEVSGGNRPSFIKAQSPDKAVVIFNLFITHLREIGASVSSGRFGEYMKINTVLDGPVTIIHEL